MYEFESKECLRLNNGAGLKRNSGINEGDVTTSPHSAYPNVSLGSDLLLWRQLDRC
jgi:hypothetical protein